MYAGPMKNKTEKALERLEQQRKWFEDHGGCIEAYVQRYGSFKDPKHYGNGGEAIFAADLFALEAAEDEYNKRCGGGSGDPRI